VELRDIIDIDKIDDILANINKTIGIIISNYQFVKAY